MNWRLSLDPSVRAHLGKQIKEIGKYKNSYLRSKNPGNAQLWCAIANLSTKLFDMNLKLNYLEKVLKDLIGAKKKVVRKKKK